jgi:hypothetical protein
MEGLHDDNTRHNARFLILGVGLHSAGYYVRFRAGFKDGLDGMIEEVKREGWRSICIRSNSSSVAVLLPKLAKGIKSY